jgi:hypothetical protein
MKMSFLYPFLYISRCSTRDACPENKEWISASSGDICPHVEDVTPTVMSVWEIETV